MTKECIFQTKINHENMSLGRTKEVLNSPIKQCEQLLQQHQDVLRLVTGGAMQWQWWQTGSTATSSKQPREQCGIGLPTSHLHSPRHPAGDLHFWQRDFHFWLCDFFHFWERDVQLHSSSTVPFLGSPPQSPLGWPVPWTVEPVCDSHQYVWELLGEG